MSERMDPIVAEKLRSTGFRWQWLFFWRLLSGLVIVFALLLLGFGMAVNRNWIENPAIAAGIAVLLFLVFCLAFCVLAIVALANGRKRSWLAREIERHAPVLLDRVNTLAFLESRQLDGVTRTYFKEIGFQAGNAIASQSIGNPISRKLTAAMFVAALLACFGTGKYFWHHPPWKAFTGERALTIKPGDTLELELPPEDASETRSAWGEIRITEPGGDLKLTKVDVLPLTVEAASSQQLQTASWSTAVNGGDASSHALPAPQEPNYAVYQPAIYLDEFGLADWDILSYHANVSTDGNGQYASEIYFIEVRPFQQDILKLEGAAGGAGASCLNKLGALIRKQQDILRQTHRQEQKPSTNKNQREEDQQKLAAAQGDLEKTTGHLYAEVAGLENAGIGTVLDQLALAQQSMGLATGELAEPDNLAAQGLEQRSLQQLVESRKDLVKALSDGKDKNNTSEETPPVAGLGDQLNDIEDFRDKAGAALKAVQEAREKQEALAQEAANASVDKLPGLAQRQQELAKELADFQKKVPEPFAGLEDASLAANQAMQQAAQMPNPKTAARATRKAEQAVSALESELTRKLSRQALGDVYKLKNMLDAQSQEMGQMASEPGKFTPGDFEKTAETAKTAKELMEQTLEDTPAGRAFGPGLQEALTGEPGGRLDQALEKMRGAAQDQAGAAQGAGEAQQSIAQIAKAFEASQPAMMQADSSPERAPGSNNGVSDAMRMLNSLVQRMTDGRPASPEDVRRQLEEARQLVLEEMKVPDNQNSPVLLAAAQELQEMSEKVDIKGDFEALRKLMDRLESYRLELADKQKLAPDDPRLLHADPKEAPAEFRERVRRYFEKLSGG